MNYNVISNNEKSKVIMAVSTAIKEDINDFKTENNLSTYNCKHMLKWDYINTNIVTKCSSESLIPILLDRGIHEKYMLYDTINKNLYSFMRNKTFIQIKNSRNRKKHLII